MAVLLSDAPEELLSEALPHKTWTREEILLIESTGVFDGMHYELIEGELINKMGKNRPHVTATRNSAIVLREVFGAHNVDQEAPVDVAAEDNSRSEPEPDVAVLSRSGQNIKKGNPQPSDIVIALEVADSSLRFDLTVKARLYARAGIPEYWVLDVNKRRMHVLRDPRNGTYQQHFELAETEFVSPLAKPEAKIQVADLLG